MIVGHLADAGLVVEIVRPKSFSSLSIAFFTSLRHILADVLWQSVYVSASFVH